MLILAETHGGFVDLGDQPVARDPSGEERSLFLLAFIASKEKKDSSDHCQARR
jgi:hypothetical protein